MAQRAECPLHGNPFTEPMGPGLGVQLHMQLRPRLSTDQPPTGASSFLAPTPSPAKPCRTEESFTSEQLCGRWRRRPVLSTAGVAHKSPQILRNTLWAGSGPAAPRAPHWAGRKLFKPENHVRSTNTAAKMTSAKSGLPPGRSKPYLPSSPFENKRDPSHIFQGKCLVTHVISPRRPVCSP